MEFRVLEWREAIPQAHGAYLMKDSWDDHGFVTTFNLSVRRLDGLVVQIGFLRIGHTEMTATGWFRTSDRLPPRFETLEVGYFSLGMEDDYYETLRLRLGRTEAHEILYALNDAAYTEVPDQATANLPVFSTSLLRGRTLTDLDRTRASPSGSAPALSLSAGRTRPSKRGCFLPTSSHSESNYAGDLPPDQLARADRPQRSREIESAPRHSYSRCKRRARHRGRLRSRGRSRPLRQLRGHQFQPL